MPRYDFSSPRLYVDAPLAAGQRIELDGTQANYLKNVMRLKAGDGVLVFNGRDGEWRASLADGGKRSVALTVDAQTRAQTTPRDLHYLFAPLKHARLDYMVQKAVEMGASRLQPVSMQHSQVPRINLERMRANVFEAAEQCGILSIPDVAEPIAFERMIAAREPSRVLVFCDEAADVRDPVAALAAVRNAAEPVPLAVLIGPEGGFAEHERATLTKQPNVVRLSLGPRILRADTAAVAALALVGSVLGDWREG
ncbi:MAG TPA: 16S rRNA (uracil(1498)-N(3))-methyltransferase [Xanthobacteraceae bacterium]|nr:16S rRNA (uracil(1498)-N(3))-methyltransferase [Xanthobacteraceae bacterium]